MISNDYDLIVHKFPEELEEMTIYPLGDVHIGSNEFDEELFDKWIKTVKDDPNGYVVIVGDVFDNTLKNSRGNSYDAKMRPREQKFFAVEKFRPIKDRILAIVDGNHEYRSVYATDDSPLYDTMCKLDLEHLFRENMAFVKINLGRKRSDRQWSYVLVATHGTTKTKREKFSYAIDGMDIFVTGHEHTPTNDFPMKLEVDVRNEVIREVELTTVVVPSFLKYGGYGMRGMYQPKSNKRFPRIILSGTEKEVSLLWK